MKCEHYDEPFEYSLSVVFSFECTGVMILICGEKVNRFFSSVSEVTEEVHKTSCEYGSLTCVILCLV